MTLLTDMLVAGNLGTTAVVCFVPPAPQLAASWDSAAARLAAQAGVPLATAKVALCSTIASACRSRCHSSICEHRAGTGLCCIVTRRCVRCKCSTKKLIFTWRSYVPVGHCGHRVQRFRLDFQNFLLTHAPGATVHVITFCPQLLISKLLKFEYLWRRKSLRYLLDSVDFSSFIDGPTNSVIGMAMVNDRGVANHNLLDGYVCNST